MRTPVRINVRNRIRYELIDKYLPCTPIDGIPPRRCCRRRSSVVAPCRCCLYSAASCSWSGCESGIRDVHSTSRRRGAVNTSARTSSIRSVGEGLTRVPTPRDVPTTAARPRHRSVQVRLSLSLLSLSLSHVAGRAQTRQYRPSTLRRDKGLAGMRMAVAAATAAAVTRCRRPGLPPFFP